MLADLRDLRGAERLRQFCDLSSCDRRKTLLLLQWLTVIGTSYFVLFSGGEINGDAGALVLVVLLLLSGAILNRLPPAAFDSELFFGALVVVDGVLILLGIGLAPNAPVDLFLLFSFCVYIAAVGASVLKTALGGLLFAAGFTYVTYSNGKNIWLDSATLLRFPFLLGVSLLYGYLAHQVKTERERAAQAHEAQIVRSRLVAGLAHDIKSPLSVIKGFAEVIGMNLAGVSGQDYSLTAVKRIQENVDRILRLVTGFLDASKAEGGESQRLENPVALNSLIEQVAEQQAIDLRDNGLTLELRLDPNLPEIIGDAPQLERVIWNLLSNAIKFTPKGGKITVASEVAAGQVCVKVSDTGIGIAKDEVPLLFSEFRRLKGSGSTEGTGLGLYIVKNIVRAHGGSVEVESELGAGSIFIVRFPPAEKNVAAKASKVGDLRS